MRQVIILSFHPGDLRAESSSPGSERGLVTKPSPAELRDTVPLMAPTSDEAQGGSGEGPGAGRSVAPTLLLLIPEMFAHPGVDLAATAPDLTCVKDLKGEGGM